MSDRDKGALLHSHLLFHGEKTGSLELHELIHILEVTPECHLMLLIGLLQIAIEHLDDGVLAINLTLMILRENLDLFDQLFDLKKDEKIRREKRQWGRGLSRLVSVGRVYNAEKSLTLAIRISFLHWFWTL